MSELATVEALREGRMVLERNGLHKGWFWDTEQASSTPLPECRVCGLGAVRVAIFGTPSWPIEWSIADSDAFDNAADLLMVAVNTYYPGWQDEPDRTLAEVLAVFDKAIALAENTNTTRGN